MLLPFNPDACIYRLKLLLCDQSVVLATDSERIHEILIDTYAHSYFHAPADLDAPVHYCCVNCDAPWGLTLASPYRIHVVKANQELPGSFDLFQWTPEGISDAGYFAPEERETDEEYDAVLELFCAHFQRRVIRELLQEKPGLHMIHAGAVCDDGVGMLLLAGSRGGKSTLTIACMMEGMGFLSDDLITVDIPSGTLLPFPRAIRLRHPSCALIPGLQDLCDGITIDARGETRYYIHGERIGSHTAGHITPLTHVVSIEGFATEPSMTPASPAAMTATLTQADCFATGHEALDLMWQWGDTLQQVNCANIVVGTPLKTAAILREWMRDTRNVT